MKTRFKLVGTSLAILAVTLTPSAPAIDLTWMTPESSGTSTGGSYALAGTVGQPDAGRLAGGQFEIEGGFWNAETARLPPHLMIIRSGTSIILSWPRPATGYKLERSTSPSTGSPWTTITSPYAIGPTRITYTEPISSSWQFYRLKK